MMALLGLAKQCNSCATSWATSDPLSLYRPDRAELDDIPDKIKKHSETSNAQCDQGGINAAPADYYS
jgi:hypothetical protein